MEDELPAIPLLPTGGEFCFFYGMAHSVAQLVAIQVHVLEALFNRLHQAFGLKDAAEERHLHLQGRKRQQSTTYRSFPLKCGKCVSYKKKQAQRHIQFNRPARADPTCQSLAWHSSCWTPSRPSLHAGVPSYIDTKMFYMGIMQGK